jgi:phosphate acyltransferase
MRIGLDIMGGDFAPAEAMKGVVLFLEQELQSPVHLVLIGTADAFEPYRSRLEQFTARFTFIDTPEVIEMHENPTRALKSKPNSSIARGFQLLQTGGIEAFISAGNTGAMMVGAMYTVKPIDGILRPSIASPVPRIDGNYNFLLDVGLNADCKPEYLVQFAQLGALYARLILGVEAPRIGLLNIGEEEGKGNILAQATYPLLKELQGIIFAGNVEGRDVFLDKADVIVCEGFVGNVVLKTAESIYEIFKTQKGIDHPFLESFNWEVYGGLPILGINKPVFIGHGISHELAFKNIVKSAEKFISSNITEIFKEHFKLQVQ